MQNHSMIHDLLSPIQNLKIPKTVKESAENIQSILKLVSLVQRRRLMEKVTESHVDMIIKVCLLRTDYRDYVLDWSEHLNKR